LEFLLNASNILYAFLISTFVGVICQMSLFVPFIQTFSGFRGNKLDMESVHKLHRLLKHPENFPYLVWVDFRNNKGITTIPGDLVQLLRQRREKHRDLNGAVDETSIISVQDAITGRLF